MAENRNGKCPSEISNIECHQYIRNALSDMWKIPFVEVCNLCFTVYQCGWMSESPPLIKKNI
jgi:hypothetical protein